MALEYVTGRDLSLTIDGDVYNDVAASVTLTVTPNQQVLETLAGRAYKTIDYTATLDVELYQDWGSTSPASVCEALFDAAGAAGDTGIAFSFDANGSVFTGDVFPVFPTSGGAATDALTTSISFVVVDGAVSRA
jgi:hypothetical protein